MLSVLTSYNKPDYFLYEINSQLFTGRGRCNMEVTGHTGIPDIMGSKKDIIFYIIVGSAVGWIAGLAGASLPLILFLSLIGPPVLLLILRILHLF
ncbi:hypothetical protein ACFLYN_01585 [Chloroflexota bacterium]